MFGSDDDEGEEVARNAGVGAAGRGQSPSRSSGSDSSRSRSRSRGRSRSRSQSRSRSRSPAPRHEEPRDDAYVDGAAAIWSRVVYECGRIDAQITAVMEATPRREASESALARELNVACGRVLDQPLRNFSARWLRQLFDDVAINYWRRAPRHAGAADRETVRGLRESLRAVVCCPACVQPLPPSLRQIRVMACGHAMCGMCVQRLGWDHPCAVCSPAPRRWLRGGR